MMLLTFVFALWMQTPSPVSLFEQAQPWADYLAATTQQHEQWVRNAGRPVPDALVTRLSAVSSGLTLLVVAEDWCSDSVNTVPYLATLASRAGVEMRVVNSQTGRALMEAHRTPDNRAATPTVILLRGGKEVGAWVERPAVLQTWMLGPGQAIAQADRLTRKLSWYEWNRGDATVEEIVLLAEGKAREAVR
jgi:hypothetical protein